MTMKNKLPAASPAPSGKPVTGKTSKKNSGSKTTDCPPIVGSTPKGNAC